MVNKQSLQVVMVGIGGCLIGTGLGYMIAERRLSVLFEQRLKEETAEMREFYTQHSKKFATPEEAVQELVIKRGVETEVQRNGSEIVAYHKIVRSEYTPEEEPEGDPVADKSDEEVIVRRNIFESQPDPNKPYVISQEEFTQNEAGYIQNTLTFYAVDEALADERDDIIEDVATTVGTNFWHHFGSGSSDPNTLHIRNERLQLDFEIVRSEGSYSREVLGMEEDPPVNRPSARQRRGE